MLKCTVEQRSETCETHIAGQPALIHFTCISSMQSELRITHAHTQLHYLTSNAIFRLSEKHRFCSNWALLYFFRVLHITHQYLMLISPPSDQVRISHI